MNVKMNDVKKIAMSLCICCTMAVTFGAKLSQSVPKGWGEDFAAAKTEAAASGKKLCIAFSGSDWCGWCVKMEKEIYSQKEFIQRAKKNFVLVMIDNPRNKDILSKLAQKQNRDITNKYGIHGFPSTIVAAANGEVIEKFGGYKQDMNEFLNQLEAAAKRGAVKPNEPPGGDPVADDADAAKDDRFFFEPSERTKIAAREAKQRKENTTSDFELTSFAGIKFGAAKADGEPKLEQPYLSLSNVQKVSYMSGKLAGFTIAAPVKDVKAMSAADLRMATCKLVRSIEKDLGIRMAVTGTKIDFDSKKAKISVNASKSLGQLSVQLLKKR